MERSPNCLAKLKRMNKTLRHEEADRVPISDFFWGSFLDRWRRDLGLAKDTDIYKWRIIGSENVMLWMCLYPDELARFIERIGAIALGITRAQIKAADGRLDGMVIWADVAYTQDIH